jgi:hypothetical protein
MGERVEEGASLRDNVNEQPWFRANESKHRLKPREDESQHVLVLDMQG